MEKGKERLFMPNIKPISDLNMAEYDRMKAMLTLMSKLEEGENSAREGGFLSADEVEAELGI